MPSKRMTLFLIVLLVAAIIFVLYKKPFQMKEESFENAQTIDLTSEEDDGACVGYVSKSTGSAPEAAEPLGNNAQPKSLMTEEEDPTLGNTTPKNCFPKDHLDPKDLLPNDTVSKWAQTNPKGAGSIEDQNFLTAGYHVGINTVGQSMRNANLQLRSEPPNPQKLVSPWLQTTIDPDLNRRPLEIGCD